jgi:hypothetical protein
MRIYRNPEDSSAWENLRGAMRNLGVYTQYGDKGEYYDYSEVINKISQRIQMLEYSEGHARTVQRLESLEVRVYQLEQALAASFAMIDVLRNPSSGVQR